MKPDLDAIVRELVADPAFAGGVADHRVEPSRAPVTVPIPDSINPRLARALGDHGIRDLYSHQARAIELAAAGRSTVVVTPTASGKTLCYNVPVLDRVLRDGEARALYLFPTKALSADQLVELRALVGHLGEDVRTFTFDGDTPPSARRKVREAGHVVVTNPDMLHSGILPHHTRWTRLFERLAFVVVDELHHYRGIFGSHLANVLRRLERICRFYGSSPTVVACSATVANPGELAARVLGRPVEVVDRSGAPMGERHVLLVNPPIANRELGLRQSVVKEAARFALFLLARGVQTIVFARSRVRVEVLLTYLREGLRRQAMDPALVRGYRGGYLPGERRAIERGLRDRSVMGVVSTNALELGIDIGGLDAAVLAGYPGSIASMLQQMGRAGRRRGPSLSVLVASSSPLDQYIVAHPEAALGRSPEVAVVDPDNDVVRLSHLKCAAFEVPFQAGESFGPGDGQTEQALELLARHRIVRQNGTRYFWMSDVYPAQDVSLRTGAPENVVIVDEGHEGRVVGEVDLFSAPVLVYTGAIYLHEGRQYQVNSLDWEERIARVREVEVDYFTDAEAKSDLKVLDVLDRRPSRAGERGLVEVSVTTLAVLYKKVRFFTHENVGSGRIHLPEQELQTMACYEAFDPARFLGMERERLAAALAGLAHLVAGIVPAFILCDRGDVRVLGQVASPFLGRPTLYVFDRHPGGVGLAEALYQRFDEVFAAAHETSTRCPCESGCPGCIGPAAGTGARPTVRDLLSALLSAPAPQVQPRSATEDLLAPR